MPYQTEFTTSFSQTDQAGVLFFAEIPRLAHDLMERALLNKGVPWGEWFTNPELAFPIKDLQASYRRPLLGGRTYLAEVQFQLIAPDTVRTLVEFKEGSQMLCQVQMDQICITKKERARCNIPQSFKEKLES